MNVPELVVPAGTAKKLEVALQYGADAVYVSGKQYGLRHYAGNFDLDELQDAVDYVHRNQKKIYLAVNILCKDKHMESLRVYLETVKDFGFDALIVSDAGTFRMAQHICPHIPVHLSTQANTLNREAVRFWKDQGVKRVILARELSKREVFDIRANTDAEIEVFVHGALCIAYAGRCYLSAYLDQRESNEGTCSQPCRHEYYAVQKSGAHAQEPFEIIYDDENAYLFNSKDLRLIEYIEQLAQAGIHAVKIEGRMKTEYYVAVVTRVYREALDTLKSGEPISEENISSWKTELETISHRGYTTGFFGGDVPGERVQLSGAYYHPYQFLGYIDQPQGDRCAINPKSKIVAGDVLEVVGPDRSNDRQITVKEVIRGEEQVTVLHPNQYGELIFDTAVYHGEMLRKRISHEEGKIAL